MRVRHVHLLVLVTLLAFALPASAGLRWCVNGTPPGLGDKDDQAFPAFERVEEGAGFSLHDVDPFAGNTTRSSASEHNPVDPAELPGDAELGPH